MLKCFQSAGNTVNPVCGYNEPTKSLRQPIPTGADLGGGCRGCAPSPPRRDDRRFSNTTGILQKKKKTIWSIGVEVEQETIAPSPKKNPGSAPCK